MITNAGRKAVVAACVLLALNLTGCGGAVGSGTDQSDVASRTPTADVEESAGDTDTAVEEEPAVSSGPAVVFQSADTSTMPQCAIGTWVLEGTEILQAQFGTVEPNAMADGYQLFAFDGTSMVTQNHYSYEKPMGSLTLKYQAGWDAQTTGSWSEDSGYWIADTSNVLSASGQASDKTATYPVEQILSGTNGFAVRSCDLATMTATGWFLLNATLRRLG